MNHAPYLSEAEELLLYLNQQPDERLPPAAARGDVVQSQTLRRAIIILFFWSFPAPCARLCRRCISGGIYSFRQTHSMPL